MDKDQDMDNVYINASDGLNNGGAGNRRSNYHRQLEARLNGLHINGHGSLGSSGGEDDEESENNSNIQSRSGNSEDEMADIPKSIIVTGFDVSFFESPELKAEFERVFKRWGAATFQYFKSFKRVRVNYETSEASVNARLHGHMLQIGESVVNCYFCMGIQVKSDRKKSEDGFLRPPTPDKQFLISPPASPPVDWQPRLEDRPNINFDLIAALSQLAPGQAHEVHKPISASHPSIVVHIAAAPGVNDENGLNSFKIMQTKRPPLSAMES